MLSDYSRVYLPQICIITDENLEEYSEILYDNRFITKIEENKQNIKLMTSNIFSYLWDRENYYNERGNDLNDYSPTKIAKINEEINSYINILVVGISRSGKSTLINLLSRKLVSLESSEDKSITRKINEYLLERVIGGEEKKIGIKIIDTPGLKKVKEEGKTIDFTKTVIDLIEKKIPLTKSEIIKFFEDYPKKNENVHLKLDKKDPLLLENNIIYYGEWDMNFFIKHGRGIQIWPDGSYYKGYWENNKAEGKGEFFHSTGDFYDGDWHNNKRDGKGVYHSKNGMEYIGKWKDDLQEGEGEEIWEDGSKYVGDYKGGKKNGKGKMEWSNGCTYIGDFENGKINGKGVYTFSDKRKYEGDFVNNAFEGKGTFTWPNGNKYVGYFKNDKREGFGIFTLSDGRVFKGIWKNGKQNGEFDVYKPKKGVWIKKKKNEFEEVEEEKEEKNNNNKIILVNEVEENEEENKVKERMDQDVELEKIDGIQKAEENKIYELDEEF